MLHRLGLQRSIQLGPMRAFENQKERSKYALNDANNYAFRNAFGNHSAAAIWTESIEKKKHEF